MNKETENICLEFIDFLCDIIIMKTNFNSKKELYYEFICKKLIDNKE